MYSVDVIIVMLSDRNQQASEDMRSLKSLRREHGHN
jgi:hypothetical protein